MSFDIGLFLMKGKTMNYIKRNVVLEYKPKDYKIILGDVLAPHEITIIDNRFVPHGDEIVILYDFTGNKPTMLISLAGGKGGIAFEGILPLDYEEILSLLKRFS